MSSNAARAAASTWVRLRASVMSGTLAAALRRDHPFPVRFSGRAEPSRPLCRGLGEQGVEEVDVLDEVPIAEEPVAYPRLRGGAERGTAGAVRQQPRDGSGVGVEVCGVGKQYATEPVLYLVLDAADGRGHHRACLPHRLGDRQAEALDQALLHDHSGLA